MKTKIGDCNYAPKYMYQIGSITFCSVSPDNCPYKQSLKFYSDEKPLFRCKCDGKVEKIVKEEVPEEVLVSQ